MKRIGILLSLLAALMLGLPAMASDDAEDSASDGTTTEEEAGEESTPPVSADGPPQE